MNIKGKDFSVDESADTANEHYLEFDLGNESYAVRLLTVKEVIPLPETTALPNCPAYFLGIMNLRGQIISIVDLRKKLNVKSKEGELEEAVVIIEIQGVSIGVVVDSINKVLNIDLEKVTEIPEVSSQLNAKYIQGVYKGSENLTIMLDIESVFDFEEIDQIQQMVA